MCAMYSKDQVGSIKGGVNDTAPPEPQSSSLGEVVG